MTRLLPLFAKPLDVVVAGAKVTTEGDALGFSDEPLLDVCSAFLLLGGHVA